MYNDKRVSLLQSNSTDVFDCVEYLVAYTGGIMLEAA